MPTVNLTRDPPDLVLVEFPGGVSSHERAAQAIGGLDALSQSLTRTSATAVQLDLAPARSPTPALRSSAPVQPADFAHKPVASATDNGGVVFKLTTRRRVRRRKGQAEHTTGGMFSLEVAGLVRRTVRFRSESDLRRAHPAPAR